MAPNDDDRPTERPGHDRFPLTDHADDPTIETERQDNLVLLAMGEPVPAEFARHQGVCAQCQHELATFVETVRLGRDAGTRRDYADAYPPASIWAGITAELAGEGGSESAAGSAPTSFVAAVADRAVNQPEAATRARHAAGSADLSVGRSAGRSDYWSARQPGRTRLVLVAAGIVLALLGGIGGFLAGHSTSTTSAHVASNASLTTVPGGPERVIGTASVRSGADGQQVVVATTGLPLRDGFYEVWLFDPDRGPHGDMVAVGALGARGRGTFTMPGGINIRAYHVVDVSAQSYGGGARIVHAQSVLQGSLTQ